MTLVLYDKDLKEKMVLKGIKGFQIAQGTPVLCWTDRKNCVYYQQLGPGELIALREEEK